MELYNFRKSNVLLFTGLLLLAAGMPVSLFLTSLSQFFIAGSLFLEGSVAEKLKRFSRNRLALGIAGIWLLHAIGLLWTTDLQEGTKDLRIKLPLLLLPLVLGGSAPLSRKQFHWVMGVFVASVFTGSMLSMAVYAGIIQRSIHDIREIFIFNISHIRFALFVCLSVFILLQASLHSFQRRAFGWLFFYLLCTVWFMYFLVFIESITGIAILLVTGIIHLLIYGLRTPGKWTRAGILLISLLIPLMFFIEIRSVLKEYSTKQDYRIDVTEKTREGNSYTFILDRMIYENGFPIWAYVCEEELRPNWNAISTLPYDSLDEQGQPLRFTLVRFLTSKGLRKDAEGLNSLQAEEIKSIERGIANVKYQHLSNTRIRLLQIVWEFDQYKQGANPSGHSVTQRFEFWKAATNIISSHPLLGVGTGDMPQAYRQEYSDMKTQLDEKYRLRAHNQYLAIAVALGIPSLLYFISVLCYSFFYQNRWREFLFRSFWIITALSMLTEDTLETQSGVTFVALFMCLLLFAKSPTENTV